MSGRSLTYAELTRMCRALDAMHRARMTGSASQHERTIFAMVLMSVANSLVPNRRVGSLQEMERTVAAWEAVYERDRQEAQRQQQTDAEQ